MNKSRQEWQDYIDEGSDGDIQREREEEMRESYRLAAAKKGYWSAKRNKVQDKLF